MAKRSLVSENIESFVNEISTESAVQKNLRAKTQKLSNSGMQIGPDQGVFFTMLIHLTGAKKAIEIGTFTGYSALSIAQGLPEDGKLICCDTSEEWTSIGKPFWKEAGLDKRIDLRIAPAKETLQKLLDESNTGTFDFAFIDADKNAYPDYYELCLKLLKKNGLIALDNMLWGGDVTDEKPSDSSTRTLRNLNFGIRDDDRVEHCLLTLGDGVMLARKK